MEVAMIQHEHAVNLISTRADRATEIFDGAVALWRREAAVATTRCGRRTTSRTQVRAQTVQKCRAHAVDGGG